MSLFRSISVSFLVVLFFFTSCSSRNERTITKAEDFLSELSAELVPDSRFVWLETRLLDRDGELVLTGTVSDEKVLKHIVESLAREFPQIRPELRMLPLDGEALPVNGLANNSVIHLRRGESSKTELVTQGRLGAPLCILLERGGKSLVRIPDGYLGWVNTPEIVSLTAEGLEEYRMADKLVFKAQTGFSYSRADEDARPVSDLIAGSILVNEGREGGFYKVVYPDGRKAYVKAEEAMPASEFFHQEPTSTGLLETALRFHGIPYLWGGSSAKAIDCSGLSAAVFFLNGILLPRDADLQALCGREISTEWSAEGLEAGDLLFFGRKATADKPERATHVAIYIGGGEFIHSSGYRERVSINHMDSTQAHFIPGYPEIFVRATRIVGEEGGAFGPIVENEMYKTIVKNRE